MADLLSCPFCGSIPKLCRPLGEWLGNDKQPYYGPKKFRYSCSASECFVMTVAHDTEEEARQQWNTRSIPANPDSGLVAVAQAYVNEDGECEEISWCEGFFPHPECIQLVTRSNAEQVIAGLRAEIDQLKLEQKCRLSREVTNMFRQFDRIADLKDQLAEKSREPLNIDKEWFEKRAAQEGDLEISTGKAPEDLAELERVVFESLPQWAQLRIRDLEAQLAAARTVVAAGQVILSDKKKTDAHIHDLEAQLRDAETEILNVAISDKLDEAGSPLSWQERAEAAEAALATEKIEAAKLRDALTEAESGFDHIHSALMSNGPKQAAGEVTAHFLSRTRQALAGKEKS